MSSECATDLSNFCARKRLRKRLRASFYSVIYRFVGSGYEPIPSRDPIGMPRRIA
jgi:hypothetical protein